VNRNILTSAGLVAGGICIGGGVTYIVVKKRLTMQFERKLADGVEEAKEFYSLLRSEPPYNNPVVAAKKYRERIEQLDFWVANGIPEEDLEAFNESVDLEAEEPEDEGEVFINEQPNPEKELDNAEIYDELVRERHVEHVEEVIIEATENIRMSVEAPTQAQQVITLEDVDSKPTDIRNIFSPDVVKKYELEVAAELPQTSKFTHVISVDEFMEENHEMDKISLNYYEADETLADDADKIVPSQEVDAIIGKESLKWFGKGSEDDDIVYVKNTDRNLLIEITRDSRSFPEAVFGIPNSVLNKKVSRSDDG